MRTTRILIAEDLPFLRDGLVAFLRAEGSRWEVCGLTAPGSAAVKKAAVTRPDVVVLSHGHAGCDGLLTARDIRCRCPRAAILLLSVARSPLALRQIVDSPFAGGALKWETPEKLRAALEAMRQGSRYRSRALLDACDADVAGTTPARRLTQRELQTLRLIALNQPTKRIAGELGVSISTINNHRDHLKQKLNLHTAVELTHYAIRAGLVEAGDCLPAQAR